MSGWLQLLCPDQWVPRVTDIDLDGLLQRGIQAIITDLDNTLVDWQGYDVPRDIREWIEKAKARGFKICIASNTRSKRRLQQLAGMLGVLTVSRVVKPRRGGLRSALKLMEVRPDQVVMVGDQIFTDILAGNRMHLHTILVSPLTSREFIGTRFSRVVEHVVLECLQRQGKLRQRGRENL